MTFDLSPFRDEYPWESRWLEIDGIRMHYLDEGRGDPVVMLHGNPTWSFYWRHLVRGLSDRCRTVVPDHIGMGLSDKPDDTRYEYTLRRRVDDLERLLDHLGLTEDLTLVLHDWGGMIGLAYADRYPRRVRRLVVLNTAGFGLPPGRRLPWQIALVRHLPMSILVQGLNAFAVGAARTCSTRPGRMTPSIRRAYLAPYDSWANRIAVHRFVQDIPLEPGDRSYDIVKSVSDHLERLAALPLLICWGGKDFVFDEHFLAEWRRRLPAADVHTFPDAGHYVLEDAHEEIVPLVRRFLEAHPLDGTGERPDQAAREGRS
jgi:haloalkane dehalogenase